MSYNPNEGTVTYTAAQGQTLFTFLFKIFNATQIEVMIDNVIQTNYSVRINGDAGGTITMTSGLTVNQTVTLTRRLPVDRTTEYETNGGLRANALNEDQDYQTYLIADLYTAMGVSIT